MKRVNRTVIKKSALIIIALALFTIFAGMAAASSDGGGAAPKGWINTDTYRVMNFMVLAVALFFVLRKPLSNALNARIDDIREQLGSLDEQKKKAEQELASYDEKLSYLDNESKQIIAEYVRQGNEAKGRILNEAQGAAQRLEEQAQRNIEHEFGKAKLIIHEEIIKKALVKAEETIKGKITNDDHEKLIDEYLEKVVA